MGTRLSCSQRAFNQIDLDGRTGPVPTLLQCPERIETLPIQVQATVLKSLDLVFKNVSPGRGLENG